MLPLYQRPFFPRRRRQISKRLNSPLIQCQQKPECCNFNQFSPVSHPLLCRLYQDFFFFFFSFAGSVLQADVVQKTVEYCERLPPLPFLFTPQQHQRPSYSIFPWVPMARLNYTVQKCTFQRLATANSSLPRFITPDWCDKISVTWAV